MTNAARLEQERVQRLATARKRKPRTDTKALEQRAQVTAEKRGWQPG